MPGPFPLISVVLCTYNGEKYLAEQLDSILHQTYDPLEIIICDDASTDHTLAILKKYAEKEERIRLQVNEKNLGYNKNFERAIGYAKADWIAIADQDDIWLPHKLASLYQCIKSDTLLVHSYNAEFKNDDPAVTFFNPSRLRFRGHKTRELFFYNTITGHTLLLHKKLLAAALPFPGGVYYDWWLGVIASLHSPVQLQEEVLVLHRQHSDNASHLQRHLSAKAQKEKFFRERIHTMECFHTLKDLAPGDRKLLSNYTRLLKSEWDKSFSFPFLFFFLKHARSAFYYRKKTPMLFYYLKYSLKKATMKVKHWT